MRKLILMALLFVFTVPLYAQKSPAWAGYITYSPRPVVATVTIPQAEMAWLKETVDLIGSDGFSFLNRRDADHWLALTTQGALWVLQVHDEGALFNLRATVDPKTAKVTVQKGVDWVGTSRVDDANRSVLGGIAYLQNARMGKPLFGQRSGGPTEKPTLLDLAEKDHPGTKDGVEEAPSGPHSSPTVTAAVSMEAASGSGKGGAEFWQRLVDGNLRFVSGNVLHPHQSMARIDETARGQKPFAIVVTCSDSRLPPEILFDQGLGDLFVIRTAGEVVTEVELGSIEYAIEHLGVPYLVVLGHKKCGAVEATLKGGDLPPNIEAIAAQIRPAIEASRFFSGDPLDNAVRENVKVVLAKIKGDKIAAEAFHEGKLNLKAAYYDIDSGKVAALP